MARRSWTYIGGVAYEKGVDYIPTRAEANNPAVIPDIEPFRSPVDGTLITGRASLREHNLRNDVVQTEELKGLPNKMANPEYTLSKKEVADRREYISHLYDQATRK